MSSDVRIIQVIETSLTMRGRGTSDDPARRVKQYWTTDGQLLAEYDINETLGCDVNGHVLRVGAWKCDRCGLGVDDIAKAAGVSFENFLRAKGAP